MPKADSSKIVLYSLLVYIRNQRFLSPYGSLAIVISLLLGAEMIAPAAETIVIHPAIDDSMLLNPGKGYVQYWEPDVKIFYKYREPDDKYVKDYISIGYTRLNWSALEPQEGIFDWSIPDRFIAEYAKYGKKVGFGVMSVTTGQREQYVTPKWVFNAGAVPLSIPDDSTRTATQVIPESWADPVFLAKMQAFIAAFGGRYDGNTNIAFVDIRDYGNWGEGHIGGLGHDPRIVLTPAENLQNNYYLPYIEAFPHTQLIAPWGGHMYDGVYDWAITNHGVGVRRDGILSQYSKDGSECLRAYDHAPAVFEYCDTYENTKRDGYWSTDLLWKSVIAGKPSYMHWDRAIFEENREFCQKLGNKIGYHFVLQSATVPAKIESGRPVSISWQWLNDGVAPLYEPCQVALALLSEENRLIQKQWVAESQAKQWTPGETITERVNATFSNIPSGVCKLAVGLFREPKQENPAYRLGIQGRTEQGWYVLNDQAKVVNPTLSIASGPFQATADSLKSYRCPDWFRDAKFGIWAHWGPQAVPMAGDWYARNMYLEGSRQYLDHLAHYGHPSTNGWKDIIPLWKAAKWDPEKLMARYKKAGARYFVAQAVHCDNFDLWNSKSHAWNAVALGPKRDVVGEWQKAARKFNLPFGVSEHLGYSRSWFQTSHGADTAGPQAGVPYDGANPQWQSLYHPTSLPNDCVYNEDVDWHQEWFVRMKDLVDQIHPDFFYTDGGIPFGYYGFSLVAHLYNSNLARHGGRLEAVYTCKQFNQPKTHGDFVPGTCVEDLERGMQQTIAPQPWQTDTSNGDWYYLKNDQYKTSQQVIQQLVDIVSKNGNLLLNVVLYADGTLPPESASLLDDLATWFAVNGSAIYQTRPWQTFGEGPTQMIGGQFNETYQFTAQDIRFTQSKDGATIYAIALGWPEGGTLVVHSLAQPSGENVNHIKEVSLLGYEGKVDWKQTAAGLSVTLPKQPVPEITATLKIVGTNFKSKPMPVSRQ